MLVAAAVTTEKATLPSMKPSSTPVTVTVWATFQLAGVKVRLEVDRVPSVVSELLSPIVTLAVGAASSTTPNWAVPPASVTVSPLIGDTVMPGAEADGRIATAPMTHWADEVKLALITTDGAPASWVDPPVMKVFTDDQLRDWPGPTVPPVGCPCHACTSITRSPVALSATVTELSVPVPEAE